MRGLRKKRFKQQDGKCFICGGDLRSSIITKDHLIPSSKGGANSFKNIVLVHLECNHEKGCELPDWSLIERFREMTGSLPKMRGNLTIKDAREAVNN